MGTNPSPDPGAAPTLSEPQARELFDRYPQAWNDYDGPAVAGSMAEDAVYEDVAAGQVRRGQEEIASWVAEGAASRPICASKRCRSSTSGRLMRLSGL